MSPPPERRIRLNVSVLGIQSVDGRRTATLIPEHAVVTIIGEMDEVTELFWAGKELTVFTEDLLTRSEAVEPIRETRALAARP